MNKLTLEDFKAAVKNGLQVLHVDIETSISQFYGFSCGEQYVAHDALVPGTETKVMSIQYKFEGDKKTQYLAWDFNKKLKKGDDSAILEEFIIKILPKAHIIVGQNIDGFDYKVLNDRIMLLGLTPINHELSLDILKLSRQSFRKLSHKLDHRSKLSELGGKHRMERQDWVDIVEGRKSVLDKMIPYGLKDVDDEQAIMYKEFNYYKKLPVKIQKIIREFLVIPDKPICLYCEKRKERKFDIKVRKVGKLYEHTCLNCDSTWTINYD